jgi:hypothetical protein
MTGQKAPNKQSVWKQRLLVGLALTETAHGCLPAGARPLDAGAAQPSHGSQLVHLCCADRCASYTLHYATTVSIPRSTNIPDDTLSLITQCVVYTIKYWKSTHLSVSNLA